MSRTLLSNDRWKLSPVSDYATSNDFQKLFASEMVELFRLAFLLTADAEKAEHCVVLTMQECLATGDVRKSWLPLWTRNALIRNGFKIVTGKPVGSLGNMQPHKPFPKIHKSRRSAIDVSDDSLGILQLSDFDRLVYVICILERYPTRDCAALLASSQQEVRDAQKRALGQAAAFEREWRRPFSEASPGPGSVPHESGKDLDGAFGTVFG